jgi:hypothetical protein
MLADLLEEIDSLGSLLDVADVDVPAGRDDIPLVMVQCTTPPQDAKRRCATCVRWLTRWSSLHNLCMKLRHRCLRNLHVHL